MTTEFGYNGDGTRTSKTIGGDTTQYVLDLAATLPVVISDTDAVYLYGLDIIAQQEVLRRSSGQAPRLYYVHDGLGSARQLLDTTGDIETNYAYDPFGVPVVGGDVSNPYRFTGEAWDAEVGLLYLRARYYQPEVGRFISKDPWPGDPSRPGTLNGYPYVLNSPVNYSDPTGLDFTGPGPACPACGQYPIVAAGLDLPPEVREYFLIAAVPHEILLGQAPNPYVLYSEMLSYSQTGYSARAALSQGEWMAVDWFAGFWRPAEQEFGPASSFTQDIMRDPAMDRFYVEWARQDPPYKVPFSWPAPIDPEGTAGADWAAYGREQLQLGACVLGHGSRTPEGRVDPVGGVLGSFKIKVDWAGLGVVRFRVGNTMDRWSFGRLPWPEGWVWNPWHKPVPRDPPNMWPGDWWGTTVEQHFYWYERHPLGVVNY